MTEHYKYIAWLQTEFQSVDSNAEPETRGSLEISSQASLRQLYVWMQEPIYKLRMLWALVNECKGVGLVLFKRRVLTWLINKFPMQTSREED